MYYEREGRYRIIDAYHCVIAQELMLMGKGPATSYKTFNYYVPSSSLLDRRHAGRTNATCIRQSYRLLVELRNCANIGHTG